MLRKQLLARKLKLESIIRSCSEWIKKAPKGYIVISKSHSCYRFYYKTTKNSSLGIKLDKEKDKALIKTLCLKDYYSRVLFVAKEELKKIKKVLDFEKKELIASIYEDLHPIRKSYITPLDIKLEDKIIAFVEDKGIDVKPEEGKYMVRTKRGEYVRSMAEYKIANSLLAAGIPYKYEFPYRAVDGHYLHPDFTVINKNTGEIFLWEHFGMMDKPDYVKNSFLYKINLYADDDIYIGKGLIVTFTGYNQELKQEMIDAMISKYLI